MKIDEAISVMNVIVHMLEPQYDTDRIEEAVEMAIKALKQQVTDAVDRVTIKEYLDSFDKETNVTTTSELSSIRHELLERKDELVSFGQLIERFDDVDAEYGGSPWTLEQIYANFNILIGIESVESPSYNGVKTEQEPCDDAVSRQAVIDTIDRWVKNTHVLIAFPANEVMPLFESVHKLPSVTPQPKMGRWSHDGSHWENRWICSECGYKLIDMQTNYCPNCGAKMQEVKDADSD